MRGEVGDVFAADQHRKALLFEPGAFAGRAVALRHEPFDPAPDLLGRGLAVAPQKARNDPLELPHELAVPLPGPRFPAHADAFAARPVEQYFLLLFA